MKRLLPVLLPGALLLSATLSGCGDSQPDTADPGTAAPAASEASAESGGPESRAGVSGNPADVSAGQPGQSGTVTLEICSYEELQQRIAGHRGKIVVVDYWSTQCPPCMEEFPHLVALSRKYPSDQVVCLSASLDFEDFGGNTVESAREHALAFLTEQQATLTNVILNEDSIEIQNGKLGTGIPVVIVYDTDGVEKARFDETLGKPFTYRQDVLPVVEQLVAERFGNPGE